MATIKQLEDKCKQIKEQISKLQDKLKYTKEEIKKITSGKKRRFDVSIYRTICADIEIEAIDEDEAEQIAWEKAPNLGKEAYYITDEEYEIIVRGEIKY